MNSWQKILTFEIVALVASAACAIIISWYLDLAGIVPFAFLVITITVNNFAAAVVLGPILVGLFYIRVQRWGLLWTDILDKEDVAKGFAIKLGSILMTVGSLGGLIVGILVAVGVAGQQVYGFAGDSGQVSVWWAVLPFLALVLVSSFMLSGRDNPAPKFI